MLKRSRHVRYASQLGGAFLYPVEVLLYVLAFFAGPFFLGPTISRLIARWGLRRVLASEKRKALSAAATNGSLTRKQIYWHRVVLRGMPNMALATAYQLTDMAVYSLVSVGYSLFYLSYTFTGNEPDFFIALLVIGSIYIAYCLGRWPARRLLEYVVNRVRKYFRRPTIPFLSETRMLWLNLSPPVYANLQELAPDTYLDTLFQNLRNDQPLVADDALKRLEAFDIERIRPELLKMFNEKFTSTSIKAARALKELDPPTFHKILPDLLLGLNVYVDTLGIDAFEALAPEDALETLEEVFRTAREIDEQNEKNRQIQLAENPKGYFFNHIKRANAVEFCTKALLKTEVASNLNPVDCLSSKEGEVRFLALKSILAPPTKPAKQAKGAAHTPPWHLLPLDTLLPLTTDTAEVYGEPEAPIAHLACRHLLSVEHAQSIETLKELVYSSTNPLAQAAILEELAPHLPLDDLDWLYPWLFFSDSTVAKAAEACVQAKGEAGVLHLVGRLRQESEPKRLEQLCLVLGSLGSTAALGTLFELQTHPVPAVRAAASQVVNLLLEPGELFSHLPQPNLLRVVKFEPAEYDLLYQRQDIRLVPRLIELYIASPKQPLNEKPLVGRLALGALIDHTLAGQAHLLPQLDQLLCMRCMARAEQHAVEAWQTGGHPWEYVQCHRCHHDRFLQPEVAEVIGYLGTPPTDVPDYTLRLPLWDPYARQAQHTHAELSRVDVYPGLDGTLNWAVSAVLTSLHNHHPQAALPRWHFETPEPLDSNTQKLVAPYLSEYFV